MTTEPTSPSTGDVEPALPPSPLHTDRGATLIAEQVVQKIAGIACREVPGVYAMGSSGRRMLTSLTERIPGSTTNVANGVQVEKGERQCAIDVSVVVEYGYSVVEVADKLRETIIDAVEYGTGLEVVEVNVQVTDVRIVGDEDGVDLPDPPAQTRARAGSELA
ncbi:Asp23/Gls24 family envelope stress response protein [Acidipropionibacterium timonense]|uniref:Asp23/Gls24 family envelope stress response protein n=1 Tax=Acidipropionibacterium timonense TaxID=2161818 RepID=UPI0010322EB3